MSLSDNKKKAIWNEIIETTKLRYTKRDNEMTAKEFAEKTGIDEKAAKNILAGLVKDGKLESRQMIFNGHFMNVYRPVDKNEKSE